MPIAIVGAGISGLAAAWELSRRNIPFLIFDRAVRPGGVIVTERVGGFVLDAGPDSLLVEKPAALELCGELGIADRLVPTKPPRTAYVLRDGRLVALPEGSFLGLPTRPSWFAASKLFSVRGKARIAAELLIRRRPGLEEESIGTFMERRFGKEARDYLAEPLLAGIHAGDVDRLSVHALFPRLVRMEQESGSVLRALLKTPRRSPARSAFVSFPDGLQELVGTLAARLDSSSVRLGAEVASISGGSPFILSLSSGEQLRARAVIVSAAAWAAAGLVRSVDAELASMCASIPYASSATVFCAFKRDQVRHPLAGSGFVVPRRERRHLTAATWVSSKWPGRAPDGEVLLRGFLGGSLDENVLDRTDDELAALASEQLRSVLHIDGPVLFTRVFRWNRATPQYLVGHGTTIDRIEARLRESPGLYLTGSGYRGTGIPDCIADARRVAAEAAGALR